MGDSSVMTHQREAADEELLIERLEIFDSEQSGGSESGEGSSGDGGSGDSGGDGDGDGDEVIWQGGPKK
jgi:hypothetical protein